MIGNTALQASSVNTLMASIVRTFFQTNMRVLWTLFMFDDTILLQEEGNLTLPVFVYFPVISFEDINNMIYILYKYFLNRWPSRIVATWIWS